MPWQVLHVRPRCEKKLAQYCRKLDVVHYLPLRESTKIYQRRRVTVSLPVFPGYLFAGANETQRLALLQTNQIVRTLAPDDEAALLHELEQVRLALAVDPALGAEQAPACGDRVRITGGPFMGIEGTVASLRGRSKVHLRVELIGQAVSLEIAREYLETI